LPYCTPSFSFSYPPNNLSHLYGSFIRLSLAKCPNSPHSPVMIACRTVLLSSVGCCSRSILPAIRLLITGNPHSFKTSIFDLYGLTISIPSALCTLWLPLSSKLDTEIAGTLIPMLCSHTNNVILSSPPTDTWALNPRFFISSRNSNALPVCRSIFSS